MPQSWKWHARNPPSPVMSAHGLSLMRPICSSVAFRSRDRTAIPLDGFTFLQAEWFPATERRFPATSMAVTLLKQDFRPVTIMLQGRFGSRRSNLRRDIAPLHQEGVRYEKVA